MPYVIIWKDFFQGAIVCEILQTLVVSSQPYKTKSPKVKFAEFKMPKVSTNRKHYLYFCLDWESNMGPLQL